MSGMLDSIKKSMCNSEKTPITVLLQKIAIGVEFEMPGYAHTVTLHARNVIINNAVNGERFVMSSDDAFSVIEAEIVDYPADLNNMGTWEFKITDNAGSMLYKKADIPPIERIVKHRGEFEECAVGGYYYVSESPVGIFLVSKGNGAEFKVPCKCIFASEKSDWMTEYRQGSFVFGPNAEVTYRGFDAGGAVFDIVKDIELNSAPEHLYQSVTNAIFGYGEPSWKGMILCNMLHIDKSCESDSVEKLQNTVGEKVSRLLGYHQFNGNPASVVDEDAQRNSLFPLLFGTDVAYNLMKGRSYEDYDGVSFAGMGSYKLYKEGE